MQGTCSLCGFRRIFASRTVNAQCAARLFLPCNLCRIFAKIDVYTVSSAFVPSRGLCRVFAYIKNEAYTV